MSNPGPTIKPTGYARSVNFAMYFIEKFGYPDFIVATNPSNHFKFSHSIRELQTVAPLVNMIQNKFPKTDYSIKHPYRNTQVSLLSTWLLTKPEFKNKLILICWDHFWIPALTAKLGVKQKLPVLPSQFFDTVYVLHYGKNGELENFEQLNNQYPTKKIENWKAVKKALDNIS